MKTTFTKLFAIVLMITGLSAAAFAEEQTRPVSGFNAIASSGSFSVHIKIDGTESLKISADADVINDIETVVEDGTLKIRYKKEFSNHWGNHKEDIFISAKALSSLVNNGSGSIKVESIISATKFSVVLSGSGSITTGVKAENVSAVVSGSGNIYLSGSANDASVVVTGSGSVNGKSLKTQSTSAVVAGSGGIYINADKELNTRITGSGSVRYSGSANVTSSKTGSGSVSRMD